jgi:hypothetical protein
VFSVKRRLNSEFCLQNRGEGQCNSYEEMRAQRKRLPSERRALEGPHVHGSQSMRTAERLRVAFTRSQPNSLLDKALFRHPQAFGCNIKLSQNLFVYPSRQSPIHAYTSVDQYSLYGILQLWVRR